MDHFKSRNAAHLQSCNLEEAKRKHETFVVELRKQTRTDRFQQKKARLARNRGNGFEEQLAALAESYPEIVQESLTPLERNQLLFNAFQTCADPALDRRLLAVVRKVTAMQAAPLTLCAQAGVVKKLVSLLDSCDDDTVSAASWVLTNLASMVEDSSMQLLSASGVPKKLIEVLGHKNETVVENCLWSLANYAGGEPHRRDEVLALGILAALDPMVRTISARPESFAKVLCWLLGNLARNRPSTQHSAQFCPLLPYLLLVKSDSALEEALQCVFVLTEKDQDWLNAVVETGIVPTACALIGHKEQNVQLNALKFLGNVCSGTNQHTDLALRCDLLDRLHALLESPQKAMRRETLWTLSNILASDAKHVETTLKHQVFGSVLNALRDAELQVRREAIYCIANLACSRSPFCISALYDLNGLDPLCDSLTQPDPRLQKAVLDTLSSFLDVVLTQPPAASLHIADVALRLETAGIVEKIEDLLTHGNPLIRQMSAIVLKKLGDDEYQDERHAEDGFAYNYQFS